MLLLVAVVAAIVVSRRKIGPGRRSGGARVMPQMPTQVQQFLDALVSAPPLEGYLVVGAFLFAIGAWGALIRRNAVVIFMCVELMINGVNLTLVAFADYLPERRGARGQLRGARDRHSGRGDRGRTRYSARRVPLAADRERGRSNLDERLEGGPCRP